ncbi:MAG: Modification methylase BamHII [Microgenomates group bacterium GW2011_GWC2_45_8]|nr:MAG: Modification methylase BamHII [Microgenomates group bacterium GW2011_GWC2_45_8]
MLTSRQKQIRDFVKKIIKKNSVAPSEREIARHFRLSASTMHEHLETLRGKGYLQKARGRARSIRVIEPSNENLVRIPLLGRIAAGQPIEAIEDKETIVISQSKLPFSKGNYYALRVSGNSMVDENINNGDIVLIKEQKTAENGQKVVALIDNQEATLKRYYRERGHIRLQPANKDYAPIIIKNGRDFAIQGIALSVIQEEKPVATALPEHKRTEIERFAKLPLNQIICGDAVRIMQQMPEDSIDLTVTSPPYDELRNYNGYIFDFEGIAKNLFRITKKGGVVVWVVGDQTIKGDETGTSFRHALYFKQVGFNLFDTMIYLKPPRGAVGNNNTYWQTFEYMFVFSKGKPKTINLIKDRENKDERKGDTGTKRMYDGTLLKLNRAGYAKYGRRTNVWEYLIGKGHSASDKIAYEHPAIFPEKLAQDHILSWSKKGDIVFDPFMGSGTTAKMAILNKRKYIGSELSREYCEIAKKRIECL